MKKVFFEFILVLCSTFSVVAQQYDTAVSPLKGEKWWGGLVALGSQMPFNSTTEWYDLGRKNWQLIRLYRCYYLPKDVIFGANNLFVFDCRMIHCFFILIMKN